jgi:hypothetical protein
MRRLRATRLLGTRPVGRRRVRGGLGLLAGLAIIGTMVAAAARPPLPKIGDHWHASYLVVVCGKPVMPFPYTPGDVHTHGDGFIHIHPTSPGDAGRNATLGRFFASAGVEFAGDHITLPKALTFRNGDRCPDGTVGQLRLVVNGRTSRAFEEHVPADGDTVVVEFGPPR